MNKNENNTLDVSNPATSKQRNSKAVTKPQSNPLASRSKINVDIPLPFLALPYPDSTEWHAGIHANMLSRLTGKSIRVYEHEVPANINWGIEVDSIMPITQVKMHFKFYVFHSGRSWNPPSIATINKLIELWNKYPSTRVYV